MPKIKQYAIHIGLFLLTFLTTSLAGYMWMGIDLPEDTIWDTIVRGMNFSIPFLGILTVHEFGHYFMARYYQVKTSLPYYIPMFLPFNIPQIGTLGAFIRMQSRVESKKQIFDIGVAGPLAGFIVALGLMFYAFYNLPPAESIYQVHPDYANYGTDYAKTVYTKAYFLKGDRYTSYLEYRKNDSIDFIKNYDSDWNKTLRTIGLGSSNWEAPPMDFQEVSVGKNLMFYLFEHYVTPTPELVPNKYELAHYPLLLAAYLALFFTALNLIPIGQLDGGHVLYGLFGSTKHRYISSTLFFLYVTIAGVGNFKNNLLEINFFNSGWFDMFIFAAAYLWFLHFILRRTFDHWKMSWAAAVVIFTIQFLLEYSFPTFKTFDGWMVFAILLGRFLGTDHPPARYEEPLDTKRKIIGWLSLVIFILCFTPEVLVIEVLQ